MNNEIKTDTNSNDSAPQACGESNGAGACSGRREFLVRATTTVGGLMLGLAALGALPAQADDAGGNAGTGQTTAPNGAAPSDDLVLKLDAQSPLSKVGGFEVIDTKVGKVVIAHTGDNVFAACSAVCTHRGGTIQYDAQSQQFFCPKHGARFAQDGKVVKGPARLPLQSYTSEPAAVVNLKIDAGTA